MEMILKDTTRRYWIICILMALILVSGETHATHIRAGEIRVERISATSLTYRFTVIAIRDSGGGQVPFGLGNFSFGDGRVIENIRDVFERRAVDDNGNPIVTSFEITDLGDDLELNVFVVEHTYPSASPSYLIGYREENRNEGVLNLANSVNTAFFIDAQLRIDPIFGINNSPVMTVLPIDRGGQFVAFFHNPGAFDPDGDSLSYQLVVPQQSEGTEVSGYQDPNDPRFYNNFTQGNEAQDDRPVFQLDPVTGTLTWDAPDQPGEYNVAFIIEEWRKIQGQWFKLGFVTRDMQIIIEETNNERPEVVVPEDICVEAGTLVTGIFEGIDADGHDVLIEAFGGPFELSPQASISPVAFQNQPARVDFSWQTDCSHVRERPYEVIVKISDRPPAGPTLVAFETWQITVVGPAPTGLEADQVNSETMNLNWDPYICPQADSIEVWRRVDSFEFEPDECEIGMPPFAGYQLIDLVSARDTNYLDDNNGSGLAAGAKYCYRLVARYPQPAGGLSYVSEEACDSLEAVRPVITNVDIASTSDTDGEIIVKWLPPFDLDPAIVPLPYTYEVFRTVGDAAPVSVTTTTGLEFTDAGLDTENTIYTYQVFMEDANGVEIDPSSPASSVRLELSPLFQSIELDWSANVPWSNRSQEFPYHYIYRDNVNDDASELVLIDSVNVNTEGFSYLDDGSFNGETLDDEEIYCYFVTTQGVYGNLDVDEPLINRSQIFCAQPNDMIPPCTPVSFDINPDFDCEEILAGQSCSFNDFSNRLVWSRDQTTGCDDDIRFFRIYFSEDSIEEEDFELVGTVTGTEFIHEDLNSFKGYYRVSAVDRSGNESDLSEIFSNDNCPNYVLPNTFSPNGDGVNDVFTPFFETISMPIRDFNRGNCPRFVERVIFTVFDRTGNEIFTYDSEDDLESNILINWDGNTSNGTELPSGTYFYQADVTFDVLEEDDRTQQIRGWVQLFR
mgnify:CR=1 FL=1